MTTDPERSLGLRERKKRDTRARISAVALHLAMERGVANVRCEDIAAAADVSPRTFNNYFPSKEAAIVSVAAIRAEHFCATLRARPRSESLHDALTATVLDLFAEEPDRDWIARSQLIRAEPTLMAEERKSDVAVEHAITAEVATRTGTDPSADILPRLAAALVLTAIHTAVQHWLNSPAAGTLRHTLTTAMKQFHIQDWTT